MFSRSLLTPLRNSIRTHTHKTFSTSPTQINTHKLNTHFNLVPFVKEDIQKVAEEVPDFKFYYLGDEQTKTNIYKTTPLDHPIIPADAYKPYEKVDSEIKLSQLENGLKIASLDKGGLSCFLSLCVNVGCRNEDPSNFGVTHFIENMAFHSTAHLSWLRTVKSIEQLGANVQCNIGREMMIYSADGLRETMPILSTLLIGNVLFPRFLPWEMKNNTHKIMSVSESLTKNPDAHITELLHTTAWQNNTLGNKLYATEKCMAHYNGDTLREFMLQHFSPDNMVFVGVNVDHDELCKWLMRSFIDYNAIPTNTAQQPKAQYTGGECRFDSNSPLAHLAIAFETPGGWNSEDLVPMTLLQSLLGGGGSFSTGGPGKGMYTQLFLNVLNRNEWVESCMAFNTQYTDSGLFGIYMTALPMQGKNMVKVIAQEFKKMGNVSKAELTRAKNSLKSSIWMNLEMRPVIIEDIARQLLMSGHIKSAKEFCDAIDSVTEEDLKKLAKKIISQTPTVVAYGDISSIPTFDFICTQLKSA